MLKHFIISGLLIISTSATLSSCGSDTKITNTKEISVGQQLTDLESAHRNGIITDSEYKRLKKALIKKNS